MGQIPSRKGGQEQGNSARQWGAGATSGDRKERMEDVSPAVVESRAFMV